MQIKDRFDVIVAGNGPAGLSAAIAMAGAGFSVALIGAPRLAADLRTTALMVPSIRLLEKLGVWPQISPHAAPLAAMRIIDGTSRLIRASPVTFQASEIGEEAFGWNMPNEALLDALEAQTRQTPLIQRFESLASHFAAGSESVTCVLEGGEKLTGKLLVAADGRSSLARGAAGIKVRAWSYPQVAMVLAFTHGRSHCNVSTEFHTETGPFTIVPLPGARSSLVWALHPTALEEFKALGDDELSRRIEAKMHSILGKVSVDAQRQFYPLTGQTTSAFAAGRVMLVGEAAHVFPPIGAQGLNLGLRDIEESVAAALKSADDPGAEAALDAYNAARRADILLRTGAVDMLNRSLLSDFLPVQMARSAGLGLLGALPPLRSLFMREGLRPGSGFRAMFDYAGKRSAGR